MRWGVIGMVLTVGALALPATASAKPDGKAPSYVRGVTMTLRGSKSFKFTVEGLAGKTPKASISELKVKAGRGMQTTEYKGLKLERLGADGSLSAHIPHVGRINLNFHPKKVEKSPFLEALGVTLTKGVFEGRIDLRGRRNFASAHSTRAKGDLIELDLRKFGKAEGEGKESGKGKEEARGKWGFRSRNKRRGPSLRIRGVNAERNTQSRSLAFSASEIGTPRELLGTEFTARAETHERGFEFVSSATNLAEEATIFEGGKLRSLEPLIEPPAPFVGSAEFDLLTTHEATWKGDLATELPGFGLVSLAGPKFRASVCENALCKGNAKSSDSEEAFFGRALARKLERLSRPGE